MKKTSIFWLLALTVFCILMAPNFVRDGMFVDGVWYATISNNLSKGIGSFWIPKFTDTMFPEFHEHPPLVFGMQSVFFKVLGSSYFTERVYSFVILLATLIILNKIWKHVFREQQSVIALSFLPIFFFLLNEEMTFGYPNNMLECTMGLFCLGAVYLFLLSINSGGFKEYSLIVIGGGLVFFAFLSKGFVGLFPLSFFFFYWIVFREISFKRMVGFSLILVVIVMLLIGLCFLFESSRANILKYLDIQVMSALSGGRHENIPGSRLHILEALIFKNLIMLLISAFLLALFRLKKISWNLNKNVKYSIFFLLVGIAGSFPILISPKQASYYLIPSTPFFILAVSVLLTPGLEKLIEKLDVKQTGFKLSFYALLIMFSLSFGNAVMLIKEIDKRDRVILTDIYKIGKHIPSGVTMDFKSKSLELSTHGYLQRYFYVSLDTTQVNNHEYLMIEQELDTLKNNKFIKIELGLSKFSLYQKIQLSPKFEK